MINKIRNNLSIKIGFIIGVIILIIFNLLLLTCYYELYLEKKISDRYQLTINELETHLNTIKEEIKSEDDISEYLSSYIKDKDIEISLLDSNNNVINTFYSKDKINKNKIEYSEIIKFQNEYYLISVSKKRNIINFKIALNVLIFEIINIFILAILGISASNKKILSPIASLSKDFNNYKFGIIPRKRHLRGEIYKLQNDFVDFVNNLEEEKQKQNRIIASISHDIKTPLTSILGYSERLLTNKNLSNETKHKYASTIYNKSLVMKEIVEEFDDYLSCNIKDDKKTEKISIKYLVDYLNQYYKEDLKEKNIEFRVKTNCPNLIINVDLSKFKRVFSNIITNSLRHFDKNKKILNININEQKDDRIIFEIDDNGKGCDVEVLDKIFEPLYTTDKSRKISGLGLSICKEIIESHNGTIKAINNKLGGFSIIFTIDVYKED